MLTFQIPIIVLFAVYRNECQKGIYVYSKFVYYDGGQILGIGAA
jgi:hypothetical protein